MFTSQFVGSQTKPGLAVFSQWSQGLAKFFTSQLCTSPNSCNRSAMRSHRWREALSHQTTCWEFPVAFSANDIPSCSYLSFHECCAGQARQIASGSESQQRGQIYGKQVFRYSKCKYFNYKLPLQSVLVAELLQKGRWEMAPRLHQLTCSNHSLKQSCSQNR